jgi:hypothetical protein
MFKEFGYFMMRVFGDEQIKRCFKTTSKSKQSRDNAVELCLMFFADMSEPLFNDRIKKYNIAMKVRREDLASDTSSPTREELLEAVLRVLTCHRSGTINSQELFCFGRCISATLSTHAR